MGLLDRLTGRASDSDDKGSADRGERARGDERRPREAASRDRADRGGSAESRSRSGGARDGQQGAPSRAVAVQSRTGEGALVGVVPAPNVLNTEAEFASVVTFSGVLSETLGLSPHLYNHIVVLEVQKGVKAAMLLVTAAHRNSDELFEVLKLLTQRGYHLKEGPYPNLFVATPALLVSVARGQITPSDVSVVKRMTTNPQEASLWSLFVDVVTWAYEQRASDIHVNVYERMDRSQIKFTIAGRYVAPERWHMPTATLLQMLGVAYQRGKGGADTSFVPRKEQQCNIYMAVRSTQERVMLRWASMATDDGPQVTMRLLCMDVTHSNTTLGELGYLPTQETMLRRVMKSEGGAIAIAGVVNSGKSTTLATVMSSIPKHRKIVTLEEPREYIIPNAHANTIARALDGSGDADFVAKLRTLKRSALNDLLISEVRDPETGLVLQDAVLTGQRVYFTTHSKRAIEIPQKLSSPMVGVGRDILATPGTLKLLVYQALLPMNCPHCRLSGDHMIQSGREAGDVDGESYASYLGRIKRLYGLEPGEVFFRNRAGCRHCAREQLPELNGLNERTVVAEMIEPDEEMLSCVAVSDYLKLRRYVSTLPRSGYRDPNMDHKSILECAIYKMTKGDIDPREIEPRFASFATIELRRQEMQAESERRARGQAMAMQRDRHAMQSGEVASSVGGHRPAAGVAQPV